MGVKDSIKNTIEKAKQKKIVLLISLIYSFAWAICKIIFGALSASYFFCISGASTLLFGFIKKVYLKNFKSENLEEKRGKSITISILLIISAMLFTFYMARLFFVSETKSYGLVLSITIAMLSFVELGIAIYNFIKAKRQNDILLQAFKGCSLASSCFAIVLTQVALLSATTSSATNFYNGLTGVIFGSFSIMIGVYILAKSIKTRPNSQI